MTNGLLPTPFHARTAACNAANAWLQRGRFSVPAHYGEPQQEALAARMSAVLIDMSAEQDLRIQGEGAAALLSAACGPAVRGLGVGRSDRVHWSADGGGLRGFGELSRSAEEEFLLRAGDTDISWFTSAAQHFGPAVRDVTAERGVLLIAGPYAMPLMIAARLEAFPLEAGRHAQAHWRGIPVSLSRGPVCNGYELSCAPDDALIAFDRLARAARMVGGRLAGEYARALLQMESGLPLIHVDFAPAREAYAQTPAPLALGFEDPSVPPATARVPVLAGLLYESDEPLSFAGLFAGGIEVGRGMRSLYSPALKGAIALAQIQTKHAAPGTTLTARSPDSSGVRETLARVVPLPFL
jgi:glycine cleavage system aminomethyltransferase T